MKIYNLVQLSTILNIFLYDSVQKKVLLRRRKK